MLKLSDILVANKEIESFEELAPIIQDIASFEARIHSGLNFFLGCSNITFENCIK